MLQFWPSNFVLHWKKKHYYYTLSNDNGPSLAHWLCCWTQILTTDATNLTPKCCYALVNTLLKLRKCFYSLRAFLERAVSINLFSYTTNILGEQNMNELLRVFLFQIFYSATNVTWVRSCSLNYANFESFRRQTFLSCCILSNVFFIKLLGFSKLITYCLKIFMQESGIIQFVLSVECLDSQCISIIKRIFSKPLYVDQQHNIFQQNIDVENSKRY